MEPTGPRNARPDDRLREIRGPALVASSAPRIVVRANGAHLHPGCKKSTDRAADVLDQIGLLPGEAAVLVGGAAEVPVGGGAPVDRPVELERAADVGRRETEDFRQHLLEL